MFFISFVSEEWRTGQTSFLLWVLLIIHIVSCSSCQRAQQTAGEFTGIVLERSVCAKPGASIQSFSCVRGCTGSACQQGYRNWRVFGGGNWKGWLFMEMCCFYLHLHDEKSVLGVQKLIFYYYFSLFFLQKKEPIMQWGIACNVVQLRCLSLLQIVWQRASLHGYKTKCWTTQHFFFPSFVKNIPEILEWCQYDRLEKSFQNLKKPSASECKGKHRNCIL